LANRVGIDCRALGNINRNRGIGRYTANVVNGLAASADGLEPVLFGYGDGKASALLDPGVLEKFEWRSLPGADDGSMYRGPRGHFELAGAVKDSGVALFHGIDHNMTPLLRCPSIVTVHDLIPLVLRGPYLGPKSWLWMLAHRAACAKANRIIAVSECTREDIVRIWKIPRDKIEVVPEGPALEKSLGRYGISAPYFLYLGGFDPRKNIGNMLLAYKRFLLTGSEASMVLCGDTGGYEEYLSDEIEELGLGGSVMLPGFIDDDDLPALYAGALALVFVSVYEGFGLPLLEAMACGTPVLASDVSSIPEVAGDAALLVDPLDPGAIARGLSVLAADADTRTGLVEKGLRRSSGFTWEKAVARIRGLYGEVLGEALT
jgi:glycosyltransferase involved in cell wall biosynthesis